MDAIAASTIDLMRRGYHNHLYVSCAPGFALHWMSRRVGLFEKLHPDVEIELRSLDRNISVAPYESDIEIRFVPAYRTSMKVPAGVHCEEVASVAVVAVASPAYLADAAPIRTPGDLIGQLLLHEHDFDGWARRKYGGSFMTCTAPTATGVTPFSATAANCSRAASFIATCSVTSPTATARTATRASFSTATFFASTATTGVTSPPCHHQRHHRCHRLHCHLRRALQCHHRHDYLAHHHH
ncbi:MAG: hypothetical protein WDW38_000617 [Sanguina aurantia]